MDRLLRGDGNHQTRISNNSIQIYYIMKSKFISTLVLASAVCFGAQADTFTGSLFIKDATVAPGGQTTLSLQLTNNLEINGFMFRMDLPEGITVLDQQPSANRQPDGCIFMPVTNLVGNNYKWTGAWTNHKAFTGNSGEIGKIYIQADASMAEGTYTITLTNIDVSDISSNDYELENTSFTLTVGEVTYPEGYSVEILPFAFNGNTTVSIFMDNKTDITNVAFDIVFPSEAIKQFSVKEVLDEFDFLTDGTAITNGLHVTIDAEEGCYIDGGNNTKIANINIRRNTGLTAGVYTVNINNIELTDVDGNVYYAAPFTTEVFAGTSPKATVTNGVVAFHGDYSGSDEYALMTAAFPTGATIDLTEVSAMAGDPTTLTNDNVTATSSAVAYGRTVSSEWGTICLPFAVTSNDNIQFYEFTGASADALTFEKVTTLTANSPAIFKATGSSFVLKKNTTSFDATYPTTTPNVTVEQAVSGWSMNGYYVTETIDVSGTQAYILSGGEFHKVTSKLTAKAFHAWIENDGSASNARLRIQENTNGIEFVEEGENTVKLIYDLQGRLQKSGSKNQLFIENGKMMYNK